MQNLFLFYSTKNQGLESNDEITFAKRQK